MNKIKIIFLIFFQLFFFKSIISREDSLIIQSTTSTRDSGFYNFILPKYRMIDDVKIKVIASGTPEQIVEVKESYTGEYLKPHLFKKPNKNYKKIRSYERSHHFN